MSCRVDTKHLCCDRSCSGISETKTPFAVEPGKKDVSHGERVHDFPFFRAHEHPWSAPVKETVLVRQGLQKPRLDPSPHGRRTLSPGAVEQMIEHEIDRARLRRNLQDVGSAVSIERV